jgi:uncharacterized protein (DUF2249 family)
VTTLDLRHLSPPEPMQQALAAADALLPGQSLEVLTPLMPLPLLSALAERGMQAQVIAPAEGGASVLIRWADVATSADHDQTGA